MAKFREAFYRTNGKEGIYSNDKNDSGGETIFGISKTNWPNEPIWAINEELKKQDGWPGNLDCAAIIEAAEIFYKREFWDRMGLDALESQVIANDVYDTAVNLGTGTIKKILIVALNSLNKNHTLFSELGIDTASDDEVLGAMNLVVKHKDGEEVFLKAINSLQGVYYMIGKGNFKALCNSLITNPPVETREDFMWGWLKNRVFEPDLFKF